MEKIILDTSVLVKLFALDEKDKIADQLLSQFIKKKLALITLDIGMYELINAFKLSKKSSTEIVIANISDVLAMQQKIITFSEELIRRGLELMDKFNLTIYDSAFVAAAEIEKIPLLTADYKHHTKKMSKQIVFYDEWEK
jgi:predicted nucleic acid-binding protein